MNQTYTVSKLTEKIKVDLSPEGKVIRITIISQTQCNNEHCAVWGNTSNQEWDFEDANKEKLIQIFERVALINPEEFGKLFYTVKENDPKIFPIIKKALNNTQKKFRFK